MGDIADMMLDGTLCACCGVYLDGNVIEGIPNYCSDCARDNRQSKSKPSTNQPIGAKQLKILQNACRDTDRPTGMYPGMHIDIAPAQIRKLIARGYLEEYHPHNPVHKMRATITDLGRAALLSATEK